MSEDRNTHFQGFAALLANELDEHGKGWHRPIIEEIIAQRVYDLVFYARVQVMHDLDTQTVEGVTIADLAADDIREYIPDLTEWPKDL